MARFRLLAAAVLIAACTAKPPPPEVETPRSSSDLPAIQNADSPTPPPDPREAALSATVVQLLETEHLLRKKIDDSVSRAAFDTYIDRLDPTKLFLLRADRDALGRHADKIDDQLHAGSLDLAHDGARMYAARVVVVDKLVQELLTKPFDHTDEEFIELDPKKIEPAANEQDLRDRWRRRLELEVMERVAQMEARLAPKPVDPKANSAGSGSGSGAPRPDEDDDEDKSIPVANIPPTAEGRDTKARGDIAKMYSGRFARLRTPGPLDAATDLLNAVSSVFDPHTTYLPPADKANFDIRMTGSLEGIGAVLRERDHYIEVSDLVPGGASYRHGGLQTGDLILAVQQEGKDPVDVVDMRIDEVVKMVRGPKNTVVRLRIRKATGVEETIAITRDVVVIEEAYARGAVLSRAKGPQYGYIHLPSFYGGRGPNQRTAAGDVGKLLAEMKKRKVSGVVLDIRGNGGGLLGDAVDMTGHLIDTGPVVQVQDSRGKRETHADEHRGVEFDKPLIVLVDRFSASASEILAGALQDYNRAIIVGTGPTHGKGTVQTIADLDRATGGKIELGVLKITIQQFFRVNGASTQREGVVPDIVLPDPYGHLETGERELEHAIAWSQIDPSPHGNWAGATWKTATLKERSVARVAKHPVLAKIAAASKVLRARRSDTRIPLARAAWDTRKKDQKATIDAASPDLKAMPIRLTVATIDDRAALPPPPPPPNGGKPDDRLARWRDSLARDPWLDECVDILSDIK
ncbi:MAG: carboxy terminal-processing peptidase [Deltaproteobacteria bacterium]|nr:carboxy terminal-processing peptidase [Deltaproteobacteria bacterium]